MWGKAEPWNAQGMLQRVRGDQRDWVFLLRWPGGFTVYKNHANTCRDVMGLYPNPFPPTSQLSVSWNTDQDEL